MSIIKTVAKTAAAAALTIGLAAGAPAAQAAPTTAHATYSQHAVAAPAAKKAAKAATKISASGPSTAKAGDDLTFTAKLTRKSGKKYKNYSGQKLSLVVLDEQGSDTGEILLTKKTNKSGKVTFVLSSEGVDAGAYDFLVAYKGGSKVKRSESAIITVTLTA